MSTTKHYVNESGKYLGGFGDGAEPPDGAISVPAPINGLDTWDGANWIAYTPTQAELEAELDALVSQIDKGRSLLRALAIEVFKLARVNNPNLTPTQFKKRIRNNAEGFK